MSALVVNRAVPALVLLVLVLADKDSLYLEGDDIPEALWSKPISTLPGGGIQDGTIISVLDLDQDLGESTSGVCSCSIAAYLWPLLDAGLPQKSSSSSRISLALNLMS